MSDWQIIEGDCRAALLTLDAGSVQTCVTSPPYFGLRDYGHTGQIGLELTPQDYVAGLVDVFRLVRDALADDGALWLNLGDSYAGSTQSGGDGSTSTLSRGGKVQAQYGQTHGTRRGLGDAKPKDLLGIPWMVAFALRTDGWYLRSDIIWAKSNPMPESVTDRPTKSHEYLFLLSKQPRYFYDATAIAEDAKDWGRGGLGVEDRADRRRGTQGASAARAVGGHPDRDNPGGGVGIGLTRRNKRSVWTVATQPFAGAHFATFPPALIEPCIRAGSREGDLVLDPFNGAGTTGLVALRNGRRYVGVELNPAYATLARERLNGVGAPLPGLAA